MNTATRLGLIAVLGLLCTLGCTPGEPTKDAGSRSELPTEQDRPVARVGEETVPETTAVKGDGTGPVFHNLALNAALRQAKSEGKLVMVDFYIELCTPCKMLDSITWKNERVQAWLGDRVVAIK